MKNIIFIFLVFISISSLTQCRTTKKINKAIAPKDSAAFALPNKNSDDSLNTVKETMAKLNSHYIDFKTFSAKIKVQYDDANGRGPDISAVVRMVKDSAIWLSLSATLLNVEVFRVLITKDSVILMDIRNKEVQYRTIDYLQDVTQIPFDFKTIQNLLIGNPIFMDSTILSLKKVNNKILIFTAGDIFKNLLTLSPDDNYLEHCKLDDADAKRNRTADITYGEYINANGINFSTYRELVLSEKNKLDIRLNFKQYEFNKDLSISFKVPKIYKPK